MSLLKNCEPKQDRLQIRQANHESYQRSCAVSEVVCNSENFAEGFGGIATNMVVKGGLVVGGLLVNPRQDLSENRRTVLVDSPDMNGPYSLFLEFCECLVETARGIDTEIYALRLGALQNGGPKLVDLFELPNGKRRLIEDDWFGLSRVKFEDLEFGYRAKRDCHRLAVAHCADEGEHDLAETLDLSSTAVLRSVGT